MTDILPLASFGPRIMICGPSNAGKSTLAAAIERQARTPAVHLDRLYHLPDTNWVARPFEEFARLRDAAILGESWVMEGNYSKLWPQRLARATGIVVLVDNRWANFGRYLRRTLFQKHRPGNLPGARDSLKWAMIHWILLASPRNLERYRVDLPKSGLPFLEVHGMRGLKRLHAAWGLTRG